MGRFNNGRRLNDGASVVVSFLVTWLSRMAAVFLLVLWAPVTVHCTLEAMPQFSFLASCCGEESGDDPNHCSADACHSVESGNYRIEDNPDPTSKPTEWAMSFWLLTGPLASLLAESPDPIAPGFSATAPPELSVSWQFTLRAAPVVRAPSLTA
jgi:hypothetical protein